MKVSLRETYSWKNVVVMPEEQTYNPEFNIDLKPEEVLEILKTQVMMENLQQRLRPLYEAAAEVKKANDEVKEAQKLVKEGPVVIDMRSV